MYQFHTQHEFVRNLINSGEIGQPFHFQAWFGFPEIEKNDFRYKKKLGGGAILDAGSYTVHAARHFFNKEPIEIFSIIENEEHEVEIRGTIMLNFGNSRTAHLAFGFNNMYQNKYTIWGTDGVITLERAFAIPPNYNSILTIEKQGLKREIKMQFCNHFIEEIKYFTSHLNDESYLKKWRNEIRNQSKVLNKLFNS